ncbi:hypothetical protein K488DRAFT_85782, partial [Vararia minispora EC-137]
VIEGADIRFLHRGATEYEPLVVAMRGAKEDAHGLSECVAELVQTRALDGGGGGGDGDGDGDGARRQGSDIWDEWDMA